MFIHICSSWVWISYNRQAPLVPTQRARISQRVPRAPLNHCKTPTTACLCPIKFGGEWVGNNNNNYKSHCLDQQWTYEGLYSSSCISQPEGQTFQPDTTTCVTESCRKQSCRSTGMREGESGIWRTEGVNRCKLQNGYGWAALSCFLSVPRYSTEIGGYSSHFIM